jgi:hypothetical protein
MMYHDANESATVFGSAVSERLERIFPRPETLTRRPILHRVSQHILFLV